ncbi:DUF732 domain-containing protein [Mycolicibacterium mucogenicum]|uniref:DUF732 domain-containing protein n=1 Tax=Mycolicibacterium mucogenicum TaxID=56689 RepID=UPI00226A5145|nr:DUF732 domain-containing protein [Mycolicibacterium mucogenicum]MCX8563917.1 DUF732 domain-containing protein [Mycolicibacterium mucogenicum]
MRIAIITTAIAIAVVAAGSQGVAGATPADRDVEYCQVLAQLGYISSCVTLASYGHGVCAQFDQGNDWYSILKMLDNNFGEGQKSADILVAATKYLCPWHESKTP